MASSGSGLLPENGVWGHAPPSAFGRAAASPQTRQMRCWLSAAQAAYHSFPSLPPTKTRSLRCTAFFPPKPLRWVSAGALLGAVIKTSISHFFGLFVWGWYHCPPAAGAVSDQPRAGFISAEKRLSQSGCSAPTNALFPPAHSAFLAFLHGGGITTLGVRFMLSKRWTPAGHGGLFAVFMPPQCSPCVGRISTAGTHATPTPNRAHSGSHAETRGGFPARDIGRVDRVNSLGTLCIVTFGTAQFDKPLSVAAAHHGGNADFA